MANKEKYMIKVEGNLVEVTPEVYYAYFRMERQERGQEEKKRRNAVASYDALDNGETVGLEGIGDVTAPSMEESIITQELHEKLHNAVEALPRAERELIKAIYFDGLTESEYARISGKTQQIVSYKRKKILPKLKAFMEFMGSF